MLADRGLLWLVCHTTHLIFASILTLLVAANAKGRRRSRTDRVYPLEARMGRVCCGTTGVGTGADILVLGHGSARPARKGIPNRHGGGVRLFAAVVSWGVSLNRVGIVYNVTTGQGPGINRGEREVRGRLLYETRKYDGCFWWL